MPHGTAPSLDWLREPRPRPAPTARPQGTEPRSNALPKPATQCNFARPPDFMAARPVSRMLQRVLRSGLRSCSSGAPVTQHRPGEPLQTAAEVSPPTSTPSPGKGDRPSDPHAEKHPGGAGTAASGRDPSALPWGWGKEWRDALQAAQSHLIPQGTGAPWGAA